MNSKEIEHLKDIIVESYLPDKIILFGSYARGSQTEESDIDVLVVSDKEKDLPRYKRGLSTRLLLSEFKVRKDVLFYSVAEYNKWKDTHLSFISEVNSDGIVIYERN